MARYAKVVRAVVDGERTGPYTIARVISQEQFDLFDSQGKGDQFALITEVDNRPSFDPAAETRADSQSYTTIDPAGVTLTRTGVVSPLPPLTIRDNRTGTIEPARRERIQMRAISLLGIAVRTPQQQVRLDRMLAWVNYWLELDRVGQALHDDPQANETWPDEPQGGAP